MPPESNMFAAKAEDSSKNTIDDHRDAVERSLASLKQAAATAETEEELDAIHAKMLQLTEEYKAAAARAGEEEKASDTKIEKGKPMTFTGYNGDSIKSTGEQEKFGLHVGQKLRLTEYGRVKAVEQLRSAKTLVVVGFTPYEEVIVQIDGNFITRDTIDIHRIYFEPIP